MPDQIFRVLWFLLPAGVANGFPPIATKLLPKMNFPMDFNLKLNGKRVFGDHKTFRGLISGMLVAQLVFLWQRNLINSSGFGLIEIADLYSRLPIFFGLLLGFFALMGDAVKSFIKRQLGLNPGKAWVPWDQIDWVISSDIILSLYIGFDLNFLVYSLIIGFLGSVIAKTSGRIVGINDTYL